MRFVFVVICLLLTAAAQAGPGRDAFDRFTAGLTTLEARFEQAVLDTENSRQGLFHGIFLLKRPDRFLWDYIAPERRQIIADGRNVWVVDVELNQITQHLQSLALRNTPATVLMSNTPLEQTFKVVELGERLQMQWLELLPHDQDSEIVRVLLAFKGDKLLRLEVTDQFGQISRFSFFDIQRNPDLADERFDYQPPDGWDVFSDLRG